MDYPNLILNDEICNFISLFKTKSSSLSKLDRVIKVASYVPKHIKKLFNVSSNEIIIRSKKLTLGLVSDNSELHGHRNAIGKSKVLQFLRHLSNPLLIYKDTDGFGVILDDISSDNNLVTIYIKRDYLNRLVITSIYSRSYVSLNSIIFINDGKLKNLITMNAKKKIGGRLSRCCYKFIIRLIDHRRYL